MGFPPKTAWNTRKQHLLPMSMCVSHGLVCMGTWGNKDCCPIERKHGFMQMGAWGSPSCANSAVFDHFHSFFRLAMPWNLKWIFFTLYCLQIPSKNHCLQYSYTRSFTGCLDLLIYMISHYKTPLELHDLG
jgi:hypothetical protein